MTQEQLDIKSDIDAHLYCLLREMVCYKTWYDFQDEESIPIIIETCEELKEFGEDLSLFVEEDVLKEYNYVVTHCTCPPDKLKKFFSSIPDEWRDIRNLADRNYIDRYIKESTYEGVKPWER